MLQSFSKLNLFSQRNLLTLQGNYNSDEELIYSNLDKVWLVLSPQGPHKIDSTLIDFNHRYKKFMLH